MRDCGGRTMLFLGGVIDDESPTDDERPSSADMQRILDGMAVLVEDNGVSELEYGPVVTVAQLGDRLEDRRFLAPEDLVLIYRLDAGRGRPATAPGHDERRGLRQTIDGCQGVLEIGMIKRRSVLEDTVCGITVVMLKVLKVGELTRDCARTRSL